MILVDPDPITPQQWEANYRQRLESLSASIAVGLGRAPRISSRQRERFFIRRQKRERDREETAERYAEWKTTMFCEPHWHNSPVHTIDGLEPYINVPSQKVAAWICNRRHERMPDAIRLGQWYGGRKWAKVEQGSMQ